METQSKSKLVLSVEETAIALSIGHCLCRKLIKQGKIPSIRLGERRLVVPRYALERMLLQGSVPEGFKEELESKEQRM